MLYNGPSEGFSTLIKDYQAYAEYVDTVRVFPDVRDGLKFVQRRILTTMADKCKVGELVKSNAVVGATNVHHPHGDAGGFVRRGGQGQHGP